MTAVGAFPPYGSEQECALSVAFDQFAKLSATVGSLRIPAVRCVAFAWLMPKTPSRELSKRWSRRGRFWSPP